MDTAQRIGLLEKLGAYLKENTETWHAAVYRAMAQNPWFTEDSIRSAAAAIADNFLDADKLRAWLSGYQLPDAPKTVGIVMAGNIPLVGFHDFLCGFLSGHKLLLKLSSKDTVLITHLVRKLHEWEPAITEQVHFAEVLKNCDAYIATGSNNTSRYFEQYFSKWPNIIRKNRTSVAVLDGSETPEELDALGTDIFSYFGLGCRNVTQLCVPEDYDFTPFLQRMEAWKHFSDNHKYRNNYDYHLALYLLNRVQHFDNGVLLVVENPLPFSAVSVVHYRRYSDRVAILAELRASSDVQAIVGHDGIPFGEAQKPQLSDFADGVDTMAFLCSL
jgi:hypothetical protein